MWLGARECDSDCPWFRVGLAAGCVGSVGDVCVGGACLLAAFVCFRVSAFVCSFVACSRSRVSCPGLSETKKKSNSSVVTEIERLQLERKGGHSSLQAFYLDLRGARGSCCDAKIK